MDIHLLVDSLSGCPIAAMGKISAVQIKKALSPSAPGMSSYFHFEFCIKIEIFMPLLRQASRRDVLQLSVCSFIRWSVSKL